MFQYEKKLQFPVNIKNPNPMYAKMIISQFGGPDGELAASQRYLSQRYGMPYNELKGLLTDIGTEELNHLEMVGAIVYQLTRELSDEEIKKSGFYDYFVDHTTGVYPSSAAGVPFTAAYIQSKGDTLADLHEDLAAEKYAAAHGNDDCRSISHYDGFCKPAGIKCRGDRIKSVIYVHKQKNSQQEDMKNAEKNSDPV